MSWALLGPHYLRELHAASATGPSVDHQAVRAALRRNQRLQLGRLVVHAQQAAGVHKQHLRLIEHRKSGWMAWAVQAPSQHLPFSAVHLLPSGHKPLPLQATEQKPPSTCGSASPLRTLRPFHSSGAACISLIMPNTALPVYL